MNNMGQLNRTWGGGGDLSATRQIKSEHNLLRLRNQKG